MCGISGIYRKTHFSVEDIYKMIEIQKHRGPDDRGYVCVDSKKNVFVEDVAASNKNILSELWLGFCRLSIRDLSVNGHQPMLSVNNKVSIVFNGEIYNTNGIKADLERKGYVFKSTTDTEVILNSYLEHGFEKTIEMLDGMFAIAIVDLDLKKIFCTRDRFGIKPFYYVCNDESFMFSSELKSFLQIDDFDKEIDYEAIQEAVIFGSNYCSTLFKNVNEVKPGEIMEISMDLSIERKDYFSIYKLRHPKRARSSYKDAVNELEKVLKDAIEEQKVSDVSLACQLSGGIDSSVISILSTSENTEKLRDSISIVMEDTRYTEEKYIDIVNEKLDLNAHKAVLDERFFADNYKKVVWHLETIPYFCNEIGILKLSEAISTSSKVLLSGEGADEIFGGYYKFIVFNVLDKYIKCPIKIWKNKFSRKYFGKKDITTENLILAACGGSLDEDEANQIFSHFDWEKVVKNRMELIANLSGTMFERAHKYEIITRLPGLLNRQDKMTMAFSLENRVPFLSNTLFDFAYSMPEKYNFKYEKGMGGYKNFIQGKAMLKSISSKLFGKEFTYRRKMGFDLPIRSYLSNEIFLNDINNKIMPKMKQREIFNADAIQKLISRINDISEREVMILWRCIFAEIWIEQFTE